MRNRVIANIVLIGMVCSLLSIGMVLAASQGKGAPVKSPEPKAAPAKAAETKADAKSEHKDEGAKTGGEEEKSAELSLLQLLEKKKAELEAKEAELKEREARLIQMNKDLDAKIAKYGKLRQEIEGLNKKVDAAEAAKMANLVKIYETMSPKEAGARIQELDEELALQILSKMKQKSAAKILAVIEPARAAELSQGIVRPVGDSVGAGR